MVNLGASHLLRWLTLCGVYVSLSKSTSYLSKKKDWLIWVNFVMCILPQLKKKNSRTSLVVQWIGIHLPMRDTSSIPGPGRSHRDAMEQLSPCATTTEPVLWSLEATTTEPMCRKYWSQHTLEPVLCNKRSHHSEKPAHYNCEWPLLAATRESLPIATRTRCNQKINK